MTHPHLHAIHVSHNIDFAKYLAISKSGVPGFPESKYACESLFVFNELTNV